MLIPKCFILYVFLVVYVYIGVVEIKHFYYVIIRIPQLYYKIEIF